MNLIARRLMIFPIAAIIILGTAQFSRADEPTTADKQNIHELADQVDILQTVSDLNLTADQVAFVASKVSAIKESRESFLKKEEAILLSIKDPLKQMKDAMLADKPIPDSADRLTSAKLKELTDLRKQGRQEFEAAVNSCVRLLSGVQVRKIARSPEAMKRATHIVQQIRASSEEDWPATLETYVAELTDAKKIDKGDEWQARFNKLGELKPSEYPAALEKFNKDKDAEIAKMRADSTDLLTKIRNANPATLPIAVGNVASVIRAQADVQAQLFGMFGRILDNPTSEPVLKAKLDSMKKSSTEPANLK